MSRSLSGEATSQEEKQLHDILQQNPALQQEYDVLVRMWHQKEDAIDDIEARQSVKQIIHKAGGKKSSSVIPLPPVRKPKRYRWLAAAAILLLVVAAVWSLVPDKKINDPNLGISHKQEVEGERLFTKNGNRSRFILRDGTSVWLNVGSYLEYMNDFSGTTREVKLVGEGYFDVAHKKTQPFIVHTDNVLIRVLGTVFNVKSYPEDKNVETTLFQGRVEVTNNNFKDRMPIAMVPNQKLIVAKNAANESNLLSTIDKSTIATPHKGTIIVSIDSAKKETERIETAWVYSRLEFKDEDFEQLARKLERWYNVKIFFTNNEVKSMKATGSFEKETVEEALAGLKAGFGITYKIDNNEIYIGLP
ncbi:FecR family protein [Terrimonas rubra]|uniref:FecR family protein n=1 Tax=Terrimonas rubra TaxID=1035890 RepID=A0ABW6A2G5_9BACT